MKRHEKKHLAMLLAAVLTFAAVWQWMPVGVREVRAEEITEVYNAEELVTAFNNASANNNTAVHVKLCGSITLSENDLTYGAKFQLTGGSLTLDLNGCNIDASSFTSQNPIFSCSGGTLTIEDNSSSGKGDIISAGGGKCVQATGGTLNISGGNFQNASQCLEVSYTTVNISGNPSFVTDRNGYNDIALMMAGDNTTVNISGGSFESAHNTVWVMNTVNSGSSLNIKGGTFNADENSSSAYVCSVNGACKVNISGGTFNLNPAEGQARVGSALVLGDKATDDMVNITGGTFHGRIARAISDTSQANYEVFYGTGFSGGIIGEGSVLTDNTFYQNSESDKLYFTQDEVKVIPGVLIKLNTQRTSIESEADASVNWYSLDPISVGTDGTVYENTNKVDIPSLDTNKITDGNTYTFHQWYDSNGKTHDSVTDYINKGLIAKTGQVSLTAAWQAKTATENGLSGAVKNTVVDSIRVTGDITLTEPVGADEYGRAGQFLRRLDLGGHTISYTSDKAAPVIEDMDQALLLSGKWYIGNGAIHSKNAGCLKYGGAATIENLDCLAVNAPYAAYFEGMSSQYPEESSQILSGTFETTAETGHAIYFADSDREDISTGINEILDGSYVSSTDCTAGTVNQSGDQLDVIYLDAGRLIVSQSPITYIGNGSDLNLGSYVYRESVPASTQLIGNEEYVGDIVITGVSVDNPVFTVTGEGKPKYLRGGVSQDESSYSYTVGVAENTDVGSYTGTAAITYTKMDGSEGTYTQKLSVTIGQATPYISIVPVASEITYGQTLDASKLSGGTVLYGTGTGQAASAENAEDNGNTPVAGTFAWKDATVKPVVADSGKTSYTVVFTAEDSDNYETVETSITLTVNKAKNTPNIPENTMNVPYSIKKVSDVTLPTGWVWQDADKTKALTVGEAVTATAIYNGADKGNYVTEIVEIAITRLACTHSGETEVRDVKEATCSEKGYTGDTYCKDCGEKLKTGTTTPALGHFEPPKTGTQLTDSSTKMVYKVTKSDATKGTVQFVKTKSTKAKKVAIPDTVTFDGITYKVTSIASGALKDNKIVTTVTIGKNVTTIGASAFYGCSKLTTVTIGANVTTIGDKAFCKCTALTKITIPSKVNKIGKQAFYGCKKLKTITIKTTKLTSKNVGSSAFKGIYVEATIKVPKSKLTSYEKLLKAKGVSVKAKVKGY